MADQGGVDAERWAQIKTVFADALERDPSEWTTWLDTACGGDETLRTEVEALLDAHTASGEFLEEPVIERTGVSVLDALDTPKSRERVGPYRVEQELGRGGMGVVYLARRDDASFHKRVAVKVTKRGMDTEEVLRRFRAERQILASLDHPNIAGLLDGGTTDDGLPYFVLEYIEGQAIDRYCDCERLGVGDRLQLYLKVCDAVQFAHRNLVVHRDLKPSNIVVTEEGVPKLLDFGIAKLLDDPGELGFSPSLAIPTVAGVWLMTPDYASPEQVRGEPITVASDVYSLGVLLYELLTGHRPYRINSRRPDEVVRVVCEEDPVRPSLMVRRPKAQGGSGEDIDPEALATLRGRSARKLQRRLAGDLDVIIAKAMHKEPERRYGSVHELGLDLRRHLKGLPVRARPDAPGYRVNKWIRRNKAVVAFLILTTLFGVIATRQRIQVERERDRAEYERTIAEAERAEADRRRRVAESSAKLFERVFQGIDPRKEGEPDLLARDLLKRSADLLSEVREAQPEAAARFMDTIGRSYTYLGLSEEAEDYLEEALSVRRELLGSDHEHVADSLANLAALRFNQGRFEEARDLLEEAVEIFRSRLGPDHPYFLTAVVNLVNVLYRQDEVERAGRLLGEALESSRSNDLELPAIQGLLVLGQLDLDQGRYDAAEQELRRAYEGARQHYGDEDVETTRYAGPLAIALRSLGRLDESEVLQVRALEIRRTALGEDHLDVAATLHSLGVLRGEQGRLDGIGGAVELIDRAVELRRRHLGDDHPDVASSLVSLGAAFGRLRQFDEAESAFREALRIWRQQFSAGHAEVEFTRYRLGNLLMNTGRYQEAIAVFQQALDEPPVAIERPAWQTARIQIALGVCLVLSDRGDEGRAL
ncbi:MAG: tetratricopeptide repeat protein, partial [Acidobacteriota bacterium]